MSGDVHPSVIAAWERGGWPGATELPAHYAGCYGCGPENPHALGLTVATSGEDENEVVSTFCFDERLQGAVGLAHGGAIAAAIDDLLGFVLLRLLVVAVTRELTVRYRRPVRLGVPSEMRARLVSRDGRELRLTATIAQEGVELVTADALFIEVDREHISGLFA